MSGVAFSVSVTVDGRANTNEGMLIILEGDDIPKKAGDCGAWLWLDGAKNLPSDAQISLEILSPCDPMLMPEEIKALGKYHGMNLDAQINQIRREADC